MTYVEAVCSEVSRLGSVVPLGIGRGTTEDVKINGYLIPKGTYIIPNLWANHRDSKHWGPDANEFKPERFLDEEGCVLNPPFFMPFSTGQCLFDLLDFSINVPLYTRNLAKTNEISFSRKTSLSGRIVCTHGSFPVHHKCPAKIRSYTAGRLYFTSTRKVPQRPNHKTTQISNYFCTQIMNTSALVLRNAVYHHVDMYHIHF